MSIIGALVAYKGKPAKVVASTTHKYEVVFCEDPSEKLTSYLWVVEATILAGLPLYATSAPIIDKYYSNIKNLITEDSRASIRILPAFL